MEGHTKLKKLMGKIRLACSLAKLYLTSFAVDVFPSRCFLHSCLQVNKNPTNICTHTIPLFHLMLFKYYISFSDYRNNRAKVSAPVDKFGQLVYMPHKIELHGMGHRKEHGGHSRGYRKKF